MKFRDILREIEDEDGDGMKRTYLQYDLAIQPTDLQAAVDALKDKNNYGIYSKNLSDRSNIEKVFGPVNPNQKEGAARKVWIALDPTARRAKIKDIITRHPNWDSVKAKLEIEDNDEAIDELAYLTFDQAKTTGIFGPKSNLYYPPKTGENMKNLGGTMIEGTHYVVDGDKIIFPQKNSPFNSKAYLEKVLTTIMDNANIGFEIVNVEKTDSTKPSDVSPEVKTLKPIEFKDVDNYVAEDIKDALSKKYPNLSISIFTSEESDLSVLRIKGFKNNSERAAVQSEASKMLTDLMESKLKRNFQRRAGIVK
jgi:hypothetical protein